LDDLLRQRRFSWNWRRVRDCGFGEIGHWLRIGLRLAVGSAYFLDPQCELLFGFAFGLEVRNHACGFTTRREISRQRAGECAVEIGEQSAARVAGDSPDLIVSRPEAESV
jgi:hypothetical protein